MHSSLCTPVAIGTPHTVRLMCTADLRRLDRLMRKLHRLLIDICSAPWAAPRLRQVQDAPIITLFDPNQEERLPCQTSNCLPSCIAIR
jgi:hypothetical protein